MSKLEISPEILDVLQKLSALLEAEDAFDRTLATVVDLSVSTLPGCDAAGVMLRSNGRDRTASASDHYALEIDSIQYDTGEGPCLSALSSGEIQHIDDVAQESRWPEFLSRAARQGLHSGASFPLPLDDGVGALNLYSKSRHAFDADAIAVGEIFARQASIALHNAQIYTAARRLGDQLNEALKTRDVIGRAKGILMEREGVSDEEAFEMLKRTSQQSNVKLRVIAERVVGGMHKRRMTQGTYAQGRS